MLSLELRKLAIEIIRLCRYLPFRLPGYHDDRAVLANLYARNRKSGGEHCLRGSGHIAFFEQTRATHFATILFWQQQLAFSALRLFCREK
jgi:hypothetical protein